MSAEGNRRSAARGATGATARAAARSNEQWLADLRDDGAAGTLALDDLRALVLGAIRKTTSSDGALDEATLDDLGQVGVVHVLSQLEQFEGRSRFTTWVYSVATRAAYSELRKPSYRGGTEDLSGAAAEVADSKPQPESFAERGEIVEIMHRVIQEDLSERQRAALLGELAGTPIEELLESLELKRNAFHKLTFDARKKLKVGLAEAGICDQQVREAFDL